MGLNTMINESEQSRIGKMTEAHNRGDYSTVCVEGGKLLEYALKEIFIRSLSGSYAERQELQEAETRIGDNKKGIDNFALGELIRLFDQTQLLKKWANVNRVENPVFDSVKMSFLVNARNKGAHDKGEPPDQHEARLYLTYVEALFSALGEVSISKNAVKYAVRQDSQSMSGNITIGTVLDLKGILSEIFMKEQERCGHVLVKNTALTMEVGWSMIRAILESNNLLSNFEFIVTLINPNLSHKGPIFIIADWQDSIEMSIKKIKRFQEKHSDLLKERNIRLQVRKTSMIPFIHGFLINDNHLFWAFSRVDEKNCLIDAYDPYIYCKSDDTMGKHHIDVFNSWFDCSWRNSDDI